MELYKTLEKYRKNKRYYKTKEHKFYYANSHLLEDVPSFSSYLRKEEDFSVIKANILIRSLMNKQEIEESVKYATKKSVEIYGVIDSKYVKSFVEERMLDLPYVLDKDEKIYIPIFSRALNKVYREEYEKLLEIPYSQLIKDFAESIIDPFETYNFKLYESMFTRLVKIKEDDNECALYDIDYQTIYFVNKQGRLDNKICLFDRFLRKPTKTHIINRVTPVIEAYFNNDRDKLYEELVKNGLISQFLINGIKRKEERFKKFIYR